MPVVMIMGTNDRAFPWEGGQTQILGVKLGEVSSVKRMMDYWLCTNGGIQKEVFWDEDLPNTTTDVEVSKYQTKNNVQVTLYKINGGGHTWPGGRLPFTYIPFLGKQVKNLNAAEVIWRTLSPYSRQVKNLPSIPLPYLTQCLLDVGVVLVGVAFHHLQGLVAADFLHGG